MQPWLVASALILGTPAGAPAPAVQPTTVTHLNAGLVDPADLISLSDIGGEVDDEPPFSISPDGSTLAVTLRRARFRSNSYEQEIVLLSLVSREVIRRVPVSGDVELQHYDNGLLTGFGGGSIITLVPRWSPDGRSLAYVEHHGSEAQIKLIDVSRGGLRVIASVTGDVRQVRWSDGGDKVFYLVEQPDTSAERDRAKEALAGFRYDDRWDPLWRSTPFPPATLKVWHSLSIASGQDIEARPLGLDHDPEDGSVRSPAGTAKLVNAMPGWSSGAWRIEVTLASGQHLACAERNCGNARELWWGADGRSLVFLRRAGWGNSLSEIVRWDLASGVFKTLLTTPDAIANCRPTASTLICPAEGSKTPRHLIAIDEESGRTDTLFDPNPHWGAERLGNAKRLHWRNDLGLECYGDLVLPPGISRGRKLPLILIGYSSRGFLRGGSGDAFPIYPLASRGYAVLVYSLARSFGELKPAATFDDAVAASYKGWADDRSQASSIMAAINMLVRDGIVDRDRIGLTGFSRGNEMAVWTVLHNPIFRAVSLMTCCDDPVNSRTVIGPTLSRFAVSILPPFDYGNATDSREFSIAANASHFDTPILIQNSDRELGMMLETESALRLAGQPVAAYVYPDEFHNFWQPAHILASYQRSIAWFDYFLLGRKAYDIWSKSDIDSWDKLPQAVR